MLEILIRLKNGDLHVKALILVKHKAITKNGCKVKYMFVDCMNALNKATKHAWLNISLRGFARQKSTHHCYIFQLFIALATATASLALSSEEIVDERCTAYKIAFNTLVNVRGMFIEYYIKTSTSHCHKLCFIKIYVCHLLDVEDKYTHNSLKKNCDRNIHF